MSIPYTRQLTRRPTHPGEMLREDFIADWTTRHPAGAQTRHL
jgi:plasmid maintenance system antidote protein VapI